MRINKFLASCGVASRRKSEELILGGNVKVNGKVITNLSTQINEKEDVIELSGKVISVEEEKLYYMLNKPKACICTRLDKKGRKTIYDLVPKNIKARLFSVGRLDWDTEGLLLLTNDGDLANALTHPKGEVNKTYVVKISGKLSNDSLEKLKSGVVLDDGFKTAPAQVNFVSFENDKAKYELTIHEGKNRQIRRMFSAVGCEVEFLKRTQFAGLKLGLLKRGEIRPLSKQEIELLNSYRR